MMKQRIFPVRHTVWSLLGVFLLLTCNVWSAPGDKGTVLGGVFKISEVLPVGELSCCGATFKVDIPVADVGDNVILLPRIHMLGSEGNDTVVFDLQGFEHFLQTAKDVEAATGKEQVVLVGQAPSLILLKNSNDDRTVMLTKITQPEIKGAIVTFDPRTEKMVTALGWNLEAEPGHVAWPAIMELLNRVTPTAQAYLGQRQSQRT